MPPDSISDSQPSFHQILVGTDFSPPSKRAFRKALALARDLGAAIHLLHVWSAPQTRSVFFITMSQDARDLIRVRLRAKIRRRFEDFLRGEDLGGIELRTAFREGRPHEEIVSYAAGHRIDLIVVGERSETKAQHLLQHLVFESVGERVRRESPCCVLTVR